MSLQIRFSKPFSSYFLIFHKHTHTFLEFKLVGLKVNRSEADKHDRSCEIIRGGGCRGAKARRYVEVRM